MCPTFVFLVLIAMISAVNCAKSLNNANNQTPLPTKMCDKGVVCNCNVNQADSHVIEAIRKLETKMESYMAQLVNKTCHMQPKQTGNKATVI